MFVIFVHTAEDGVGDGEGVQRAGGAFPDCHRRHEGNIIIISSDLSLKLLIPPAPVKSPVA